MTQALVVDALQMAYDNELPEQRCLSHSDRGSQYCSQAFQAMLQEYRFRSSMSRRVQCWDNAADESFWATRKQKTLPVKPYFNPEQRLRLRNNNGFSITLANVRTQS